MEYIITCAAKREREICVKSKILKLNILIIGIIKQASNGVVNKKTSNGQRFKNIVMREVNTLLNLKASQQ